MEPLNDNQSAEPKPQRRRAFRLRIPKRERLIASIDGIDHVVVEMSEFGLVVDAADIPSADGVCGGVIHWDDEHHSKFTGCVGELTKGGRVIKDVTGISMSDMIRQQRKIMKRYPSV